MSARRNAHRQIAAVTKQTRLHPLLGPAIWVCALVGCETISDDEYAARLRLASTTGSESDTGQPATGGEEDCPGGPSLWFADMDGDGYGDPLAAIEACEQPSGTVANYDDCDDSDPDVAIPTSWYLDADEDGVGGDAATTVCQPPAGYVPVTGDCNDNDAAVFPGAIEVCDGVDNDCNGLADDEDPNTDYTGIPEVYRDNDADGVGSADDPLTACTVPSGYVTSSGDCDDDEPLASPELSEVCNDGIDNDCDGTANDCPLESTIVVDTDADIGFYTDKAFVSHGQRVRGLGDISGDGLDDLAIFVPGDGGGAVYIQTAVTALTGDIETEAAAGAKLAGPDEDGLFGQWMDATGDIDGDGFDDLAIGDPYDDTVAVDAGAAWVFTGPISGTVDVDATGFRLFGEGANAKAGWVIDAAGDVNSDGEIDFLVGAYTDASPLNQAGAAYLVHGPVTGDRFLADAHWVVRGSYQDRVGSSAAGGADFNGDGLADLVIGAERDDPDSLINAGSVMVFYGPVTGTATDADADAMRWSASAAANTGGALAVGGDINGDGLDDLLVGASGENGGGASGSGAVFVVAGPVSGLADLSGATARIDGSAAGDDVGSALSIAADMNWDGRHEVFLGARGVDQGSGERDGGAYLWFGPVSGTAALSSADVALLGGDGEQVGASVDGSTDFNADGLGDLVVGAPTGNRAFVVLGGGL